MTDALKVLGQSEPVVATLTDLYTVPASTMASCSCINVCNPTGGTIKYRISVAIAGAADAQKQYLFYDVALAKNASFTAVIGLSLAATDVVRVYSDTATVSFNLFGVEVS